jgi:hypothetical protein
MNRSTPLGARAAIAALLAAGVLAASIAGPTLAAKGGGKPGGTSGIGSISVVYMDGATAAFYGARVTFNVATTATPYPYVHLRCYQNGTLVLDGWQGFFATALGHQWMYLGPTPAWTGGAASCSADLDKSTSKGWSVLATTTFPVNP